MTSQEKENLKAHLRKLRSPGEMSNFISSEEVGMSAMRSAIMEQCQGESLAVNQKNTGYKTNFTDRVLSNRDILELLVFSGECASMRNALNILEVILNHEPGSTMPNWKLNLAVATALTFSTEVRQTPPYVGLTHYSVAADKAPIIDGVARYHNFVRWAEQHLVFDEFYELSAWHMRHIVGSRVSDDELKWAYNHTRARYKNPGKIGYIPVVMVSFRRERLGVWYEDIERYYNSTNINLKMIHDCGGATGAISHFGAAMAQIHGAPAVILFNPKTSIVTHAWSRGGSSWILANKRAGDWKDLYILPGYVCQCSKGDVKPCIVHSRSAEYQKKLHLVSAMTLLDMCKKQGDLHGWKLAHNAMFAARLMREEWQLDKHFPGFSDMFTTFSNGTLQGSTEFLGPNPGYTLAAALDYNPPSDINPYTRHLLPIKRCTVGQYTVDLYLEHMSHVHAIDLQWHQGKVTPYKTKICYKADGRPILTTTDEQCVPDTLVDGISIEFSYEAGYECFNLFKMLKLCTYGVSYNRDELLTTIIDQRFEGPVKECLSIIQHNLYQND